jgi:hypothetical protein
MKRSERTQMYLDLYNLSLTLEANQATTTELVDAMCAATPHSLYYDAAQLSFAKLKALRQTMYEKETRDLMTLCGQSSNAIPIGTLSVDNNGKVTADV